MIRQTVLFICLVIYTFSSFAQNTKFPYQLNLKKDLIIGGVSGLSLFSSSFLKQKTHNDPESYFDGLNRNDINRFDRSTTMKWNPNSDLIRENLSTVGTYGVGLAGSLGLAALQGIQKNKRGSVTKNILTTGVMLFEGVFFVLGASDLAKTLVNRPRPYAYNSNVSYQEKIAGEDYKESFLSGTSAITSYGMFFTAKVFSDLYPHSKWRHVGWVVASAYSGYTAWLAIDAGHHFPTDVIAGTIIGAGTAFLIPTLHKKGKTKDNQSFSFNISPALNGLYAQLTF